jgi:hypothetical protein
MSTDQTTNPVAARLRSVSTGGGSHPNSKIKDLCSDGAAEIERLERAADEIERLRAGLRHVRKFLENPEWGTIRYMEGGEVYDDKELALFDIRYALGETET